MTLHEKLEYHMNLYERIEIERKKRNMKSRDLCHLVDMKESTYSIWKKEDRNPDINTLHKIARVFNVSIEYLITGENAPSLSNISPEEQQLLTYYCVANEEGKDRIMEQAEFLSGKYSLEPKNNREKNS